MAIRVWRCEYCTDTFNTLKETLVHEELCSSDPRNRMCDTCKHFNACFGSYALYCSVLAYEDSLENVDTEACCLAWSKE